MAMTTSAIASAIVHDPLLSLVSPELEVFENAEERRLMYVAMVKTWVSSQRKSTGPLPYPPEARPRGQLESRRGRARRAASVHAGTSH